MRRILVCLDGSERARAVLATAVSVAEKNDARLHLFRSVGLPSEVDQESVTDSSMSLMDRLTREARGELDALSQDLPESLIASVDVRMGVAWDAICRQADELDCDLVVIGSHGYSGLDRILGTTAAKVVNHAHCSVLVVREPRRPSAE